MLRSSVFVVEQNCAYQDLDGRDLLEGTRHLIGRQGTIAAYARILAPEAVPEHGLPARGEASPEMSTPRIGRVIVAPQARGQQLGRRVIERAVRSCEQHWPGQPIELGAQAHLVALYGSVGFVPVGDGFVEDGIPHQWMRRETRADRNRRPYPCRVLMLLAPRYWAVHLLMVLAVAASVALGLWQYDAWGTGRAAEARDLSGAAARPIDRVMGGDDPFPGENLGRPVSLRGEWLGDGHPLRRRSAARREARLLGGDAGAGRVECDARRTRLVGAAGRTRAERGGGGRGLAAGLRGLRCE